MHHSFVFLCAQCQADNEGKRISLQATLWVTLGALLNVPVLLCSGVLVRGSGGNGSFTTQTITWT